jgi:hypothetical protein
MDAAYITLSSAARMSYTLRCEVCLLSQEAAVLRALKAAIGVQNPSADAWKLLGMFYEAVHEPRSVKEMAFRWLRQAQKPGWHQDPKQAMAVADSCDFLARCVDSLLSF